jgi:alkylated DNA repair dioxygenase AlkB
MADAKSELIDPGQRFPLVDAEVTLWRAAFTDAEASRLFDELRRGLAWRQEEVTIFGQRRLVPRLVAWHGDPGARYTYSGTAHEPLPWTPGLGAIRARIHELAGHAFNSVLLNLYRDGRDGMGWHSDDEPELGQDPVIASVSLGATRTFCMRHRRRRDCRLDLSLPHGSLLLMVGPTQHHWLHAVPKTSRTVGERINLTFRTVSVR